MSGAADGLGAGGGGGGGGLPLIGLCVARVVEVAPVAIHGDLYYDAVVQVEGAGGPGAGGPGAGGPGAGGPGAGGLVRTRLASHACAGLPAGQPEPGQRLSLQVLMGQVTRAELAR
jgi:hypothetical protein